MSVARERAQSVGGKVASFALTSRPWQARYGVALVATLSSIAISLAFLPASDTPVYSLLVGAVAISAWYGGLGPGLLAIACGWGLGLLLFVGPAGHPGEGSSGDLLRWGVPARRRRGGRLGQHRHADGARPRGRRGSRSRGDPGRRPGALGRADALGRGACPHRSDAAAHRRPRRVGRARRRRRSRRRRPHGQRTRPDAPARRPSGTRRASPDRARGSGRPPRRRPRSDDVRGRVPGRSAPRRRMPMRASRCRCASPARSSAR